MKGATPAFKQKFFLACCALLLLVSGCAQHTGQRSSDDAAAAPSAANIGQPIRVSSADADAAEPATAAAPDGSVYVAWVEHRRNDEADVMLARFNDAGQMQGEPARVNPEAGRATAWRGDPPTVAASTDGVVYVGWTAREASPRRSKSMTTRGRRFTGCTRWRSPRTGASTSLGSTSATSRSHSLRRWPKATTWRATAKSSPPTRRTAGGLSRPTGELRRTPAPAARPRSRSGREDAST